MLILLQGRLTCYFSFEGGCFTVLLRRREVNLLFFFLEGGCLLFFFEGKVNFFVSRGESVYSFSKRFDSPFSREVNLLSFCEVDLFILLQGRLLYYSSSKEVVIFPQGRLLLYPSSKEIVDVYSPLKEVAVFF